VLQTRSQAQLKCSKGFAETKEISGHQVELNFQLKDFLLIEKASTEVRVFKKNKLVQYPIVLHGFGFK
jgi:hypothetical protein